MSNLPTFDQIAAMSDDDMRKLSIETIVLLDEALVAKKTELDNAKALLDLVKETVFGPLVGPAYQANQADTGTVELESRDGFVVKAERKKTVVWDQDFLATTYEKIVASGDDPAMFITKNTTTIYSVSETAFKGWPIEYQQAFMPGRTVKPAKSVIKITKEKE